MVRTPAATGARISCLLVVLAGALLACKRQKPEPTQRAPESITINKGGDGGYQVSGGAPLAGDPKTCAAFKACCTLPELGLACALTQTATKGDCAAALDSIRKQIAERALTAPTGCQ
ncbi:MAG TPA: hypothetical protein PKD61_05055 [Polyangiaceae bacterium]|nr:hypothetical protein [Polyangiaceae bacterium]